MEDPERLFACRLALALGKSLTDIAQMPNSEFRTWRAYNALEPFGSPTDDQRFNALMQLIFSANAPAGTKIPTFFTRWELPREQSLTDKIKSHFKGYMDRNKRRKRGKQPSDIDPQINTTNNKNEGPS